ncbi:MAG TPA: alpha-L-glutamate ligase [Armatimonadota bacterium]|jgi:glutathione synthase/RimK-type ligase-like ATP-grasp enzyme
MQSGVVLVLGPLSDPVTAYICMRLISRGADFMLVDLRQDRRQFEVNWSISGGCLEGWIRNGSRRVNVEDVRSAYVRQAEPYDVILAMAESLPIDFVNPVSAFASNSSKPFQQAAIQRSGFSVPKTLVTNDPEEARRFWEECGGRVVRKSVSDQMSIVRGVREEDLERLPLLRNGPTQFQEFVAGVETRVHTVGHRVFATEITSGAMDYRYAERERTPRRMRAVSLPDEIAERCLRLSAELGLRLAGIDLRRDPDGRCYCWEANPMPGFTFFENTSGQRIGDAVADLLCGDA